MLVDAAMKKKGETLQPPRSQTLKKNRKCKNFKYLKKQCFFLMLLFAESP